MPNYDFENEKGEKAEFFLKMSEAPKFGEIIEIDGKKWKRILNSFNCASDMMHMQDPFDKTAFLRATNKNGGTFGDMYDLSKEYSERRKEKDGVDIIGQKNNEARKAACDTLGVNADDDRIRLAKERLKKLGVSVKEKKTPTRPILTKADKREIRELKKKAKQ